MKKHYELVYIIPVKTDEYDPKPVIDLVNQTISEFNGDKIRTEDWGKRKLAYQIKGFSYGHYVLEVVDFDPADVKAFDAKLNNTREVLRYQIISVSTTEPTKKVAEQEAEQAKRSEEKTSSDEKKVEGADETDKTEETKKEKKVSMEELDKKIDEILNV